MSNALVDSVTERLLAEDRKLLADTKFPIVTISGTFRDVVEQMHDLADDENHPDVTLSRAHYSMALGVAVAAWGGDEPAAKKAWLVEPTNYVTRKDWKRVSFTATVGRVMARSSLLEKIKKIVLDRNRKSFPLTTTITPPLLFLTESVTRPIISMHIVTGNILAKAGKTVVQVVTDPHVREDYVEMAHLPNITFCVFDENTRYEFFQVAAAHGKTVDPSRVIVTGPPIDPRVLAARDSKKVDSWKRRPLRILLTTGGLGTNKDELAEILEQLLPLTRKKTNPIQVVYYAGTNPDHVKMVKKLLISFNIRSGKLTDRRAAFRLLHSDDIVDANNLLLLYGLTWADVVYTKPSGDMAYDAAAAGCAQLFLRPWGEWELNIREIFLQLGTAQNAKVSDVAKQIMSLQDRTPGVAWLERALERTHSLPPHFLRGSENILNVARRLAR
jgi:hypothetical protein